MKLRMSVCGAVAGGLWLCAAAGQAGAVGLQNATATFSQTAFGNYFASTMIDGNLSGGVNGWAIFNTTTTPQTAAFETVADLTAPAIRVNLLQVHTNTPGHTVGRFRFSATQDDRATFCDGLQTGGAVAPNWTVLTPGSISLPTGTTSTVLADKSVLIGGANVNGSYVVTFDLPFGSVTGIRLEVLEDPSLPTSGPGRHSNGNFVLTELFVTALPCVPDVTTGAVAGQPGYGSPNGIINNDDFFYFLSQFAAGNVGVCDLTTGAIPGQPGYGVPNGVVTNDDFFYFLTQFAAGC